MEVSVLGVDPSSNGTGIAFPSGVTASLPLNTNTKNVAKGSNRIVKIMNWLDGYDYSDITHVCIEGYAFGMKAQAGNYDRAELVGTMKLFFLKKGKPLIICPPSTLKKFVTGKGNADKEEMVDAVFQRWGYDIPCHDEADAFGLSMFGEACLGSKGSSELFDKAEYVAITRPLQTFAFFD